MARSGDASIKADLASLRGRRVGALANSLAFEMLRGTAETVLYEGVEEPYSDLLRGRTDAVLLDGIIATRYDAALALFLKGAANTLLVSVLAMALAIPLGLGLSLARAYGGPAARGLASAYVEIGWRAAARGDRAGAGDGSQGAAPRRAHERARPRAEARGGEGHRGPREGGHNDG